MNEASSETREKVRDSQFHPAGQDSPGETRSQSDPLLRASLPSAPLHSSFIGTSNEAFQNRFWRSKYTYNPAKAGYIDIRIPVMSLEKLWLARAGLEILEIQYKTPLIIRDSMSTGADTDREGRAAHPGQ
jgi:hypothetical protein